MPPVPRILMLCNYLQNVAAIIYIFVLQLSTFLFYNKQLFLLPGQAWCYRNPSIDSISSDLQESDISIRILSEIKIRTGEDSSERSFLAASCSDGSLTKTISCSDSDAGSSFASLRTQYPIVDKGIPFSAHHCLHVFPLVWHCWIRSAQSFAFSSLFIVYRIPPEF